MKGIKSFIKESLGMDWSIIPGQCYTNDGENFYIRIKK